MTISQFIHSSVDRHLDCFYFLIIMNNVSPNIHVQILTWIYVFISLFIFLEYIFSQIGIAELYCNSVANPLNNNQTVLQSGCATSQWSPPRTRVLVSPHTLQHLLFLIVLIIAILTGGGDNLTVFLIYISLIISKVEHLFMGLLAICVSSLGNFQFSSSVFFLIRLFAFMWLSCAK